MTPMTRGDGIGKHRPIMGPVEINATCRFEACPQWVAILKHIQGKVQAWQKVQPCSNGAMVDGATPSSVFQYGQVS